MEKRILKNFRDEEYMSVSNEETLTDVIKFLNKNRKKLLVILSIIILNFVGFIVFSEVRTIRSENAKFSSANLDRVERGLYRLRVETFGNRDDFIRADSPIDFDRELNITISEERDLLVLRVENLNETLVIEDISIRGRLGNRVTGSGFHIIYTASESMNLYYGEISRGIPVPVFRASGDGVREYHNAKFLRIKHLLELRDFFELEIIWVNARLNYEVINIVYDARYDRYMYELEEI